MAISAEEIIIDLKINDQGSAKSLNELEDTLKNLKDALKNTAVGSEDFKKLQQEVIKADSKIKNLNKSIEGLDTEQIAGEMGKLAGGISASFTAVSAVVGAGSEDFEKFTQKIVTGIAVTQGLKGVTEAWTGAAKLARVAQVAWNAAMLANPIGLMVAAVAALTAGVYLLYKAFEDNSTALEKNNKLLLIGTEAHKNFEASIKASTNALIDIKIAVSDLDDTYEGLELTIQKIIDAETEALEKAKETSAARIAELEKEIESKRYWAIDSAKLEEEVAALQGEIFKTRVAAEKEISNLREATAGKLYIIQKKLTDNIAKLDKDQLQSFKALQDKIISKIRDTNNEVLSLQLSTYAILNSNRAGLADYEIELLERNAKEEKRIRTQNLNDEILAFKYELANLSLNASERRKVSIETATAEMKAREEELKQKQEIEIKDRDAFIVEQVKRINDLGYFEDSKRKILQDGLDRRIKLEKAREDGNTIIANNLIEQRINIQKDASNRFEAIETNKTNEITSLIKKREEGIAKLEIEIVTNLVAEKARIREDFNKQIIKDSEATSQRLKLLNYNTIQTEIANITEVNNVEEILNENRFRNIIDLEEKIALTKLNIQNETEKKTKQLTIARLELIKDKTEEEIELIRKLKAELIYDEIANGEEEEKIKREFGQKRIQLEKDINKGIVDLKSQSLEMELELHKGNIKRTHDIKVEQLKIEYDTTVRQNKQMYEELMLLAVGNSDAQLKITEAFEAQKAVVEAKYRKDKLKNDVDAYVEVAKIGEQFYSDFQEVLANTTNARLDEELTAKTDAIDKEKELLDARVEAGIETEASAEEKRKELDKEKEDAEKKYAYEKAKREKEAALIKIVINTAIAVAETIATPPLAILAAATGAAQAAIVQSQPLPQLRRGGKILKGPKHEQGGMPLFKGGQQIAEVEGGETIMTAGVADSPVLLAAASRINQLAGGISLDNKRLTSTVAGPSGGMAATIDEASLTRVMNRVASIPVVNIATKTTKVDRQVKNIEAKSRF